LFVRQPKGVTLTPAGQALLRRALRIRVEYDDTMRELQQMKTGQLGVLRVGYTPTVDESLVAGAIRQLLLERPAAHVKLFEDLMPPLLDRLLDGHLDLIIGPRPLAGDAGLAITPLYDDRLRVVADRKHPLFRKASVCWADAAAEPWLLPAQQNRLRQLLDQKTLAAGLPPLNVRVETHAVSLGQFGMLLGTRLLSLGRGDFEPSLRRLGLELLDVHDLDLAREVASIHRGGAYVSPLSERLQDLLQAQAQGKRPA
jgi:DNA-binding transcriptional LysR family regulator